MRGAVCHSRVGIDRWNPDAAVPAPSGRRYALTAVLVVTGLLAWRLWVLALFPYDLYGDEAQYWTWAQALDWGYYSKPPVIAWLIAATTAACGDGVACVKLASPLLYAATALVLYAVAHQLYGPRAGLAAAVLFALLPAISLGSMVITTDAPLLFFWALGLLAFVNALERPHCWRWWLLAGAAGGLGLLSKYSMSFFAVSALLFLLSSPEHRRWLARPQPWVAAGLAGVIYLPNLIWNLQHGLASYRHTQEISHVDQARVSLQGLADFFFSQFAVFGPVLFTVLLVLLFWHRGRLLRDPRARLLVAFFLPWFLLVLSVSLLSRAHANWAMPAYLSALVWVAAWLTEPGRWRQVLLWASLVIHLLFAGALYNYDHWVAPRVAGLDSSLDPFKRTRGWAVLGAEVSRVQREHPDAPLLTQDRMLTAQLMYYAEPPMQEVVKWNPAGRVRDHYDLVMTMEGREGQDFLLIRGRGELPDQIRQHFDAVKSVASIRVPLFAGNAHRYEVFLMQGFRGYKLEVPEMPHFR